MKTVLRRFVLSVMWRAVRIRVAKDKPYVIAVTGSVGKTSTKEAIATVLEKTGKPVVKTMANMATDTGIPLSLLGFGDRAKTRKRWLSVIKRSLFPKFPKFAERPYYVLELSSDTPGDLAFLAKHFTVNAAVFTTGGPVHMELYGSQEAVFKEIESLLPFVVADGYVAINGDDPHLAPLAPAQEALKFGMGGKGSYSPRASIAGRADNGLECKLEWEDGSGRSLSFVAAVTGEQQLYPLIAAAAIAAREGVDAAVIKEGLEAYAVPAGRGRIIHGRRDVTIVDDTANSSTEAVLAGLSMLKPFAGDRRVVAVLGTMNELGSFAESSHRQIGAAVFGKADYFVALGPFAGIMIEEAEKAGMSPEKTIAFATPEQFMSQLAQVVQKEDVVYLKASQNGMMLERVVKLLMAEPERAAELLVRQGREWEQ